MFHGHSIGIVIPMYNEQDKIGSVIERLPTWVDKVYVVDDASSDRSVPQTLNTSQPLVVIKHERNSGVGAAIISGYQQALADELDIAVVMAGDGQMDPADLPQVLMPIVMDEADYVKGNRFHDPNVWREMPRHRVVGNLALSFATRMSSGLWHVFDSQCGYTAMSKSAMKSLEFDRLWPRYGYPNYLLAMLSARKIRVKDVPVQAVYGDHWRSGINVKRTLVTFPLLLTASFLRRKMRWRS